MGVKILVTGGSGFVGLNLIKHLIKDSSKEIYSIDKKLFPDNVFEINDKFEYLNIDLSDSKLKDIVRDINPHIIFNLAAESQVLRSAENPLETYKSNIFGTLNLFESVRLANINPKIIHASTDKVYGISNELPYKESHKLHSLFTYDISKISSDLIAQNYKEIYGHDIVIFRSSNIYGPYDFNFDRIIPHIIKQLLEKKQPIFRSDGKFLREYLFVDDLVKYLINLTENKSNHYIFNLGSEEVLNVMQVFKIISKFLDSDLDPIVKNENLNEIPEQKIDATRFFNTFEVKNNPTKFESGIKSTILWYKKYYEKK